MTCPSDVAPLAEQKNLLADLRGWKETDGMSDDARTKLYYMRLAADEIERLDSALREIIREESKFKVECRAKSYYIAKEALRE